MRSPDPSEIRTAISSLRGSFAAAGAFSGFINLLMLVAPLYMLQVYDRVLGSRSTSTLIALTVIACALLVVMGLLDWVRSRVLVTMGARMDVQLSGRVFSAVFGDCLKRPGPPRTQQLRDLDALRQFMTGTGLFALFDIPWIPVFLLVVYLFHPILGVIATLGAIVLVVLAGLNEALTRHPLEEAGEESARANVFAEVGLRNAEVLEALSMVDRARARWLERHRRALALQAVASDRAGSFTAASKATRLLLQVGILGAGAALALAQEITPGTMIAASILMGRAVAPVEQAIGNWRSFVAARAAYARLVELLDENPPPPERTKLPAPRGSLTVEDLVAAPPGVREPVLHGISFALEPGEALGVIGPTAAGKSTLARCLVGVWSPAHGSVRLDGADLRDWPREDLGPRLGYLPQDVELFNGTVAENVARLIAEPNPDALVLAARRAGVHELILGLGAGYDTQIGIGGSALSAGQRQRIGLARALFGDPVLVVLDEPNSNLDAAGDAALTAAIRDLKRSGATVVVIAHRPSAITAVDKLLVLRDGRIDAFGPRDEVLARSVRTERNGNAGAEVRT